MAPGSIFYHISFRSILFCNLYFSIYITEIPKIFTLLSLSYLTFASGREGIDNPFIMLVAKLLFVCAATRWLVCLLIDWYLCSQNWGKYLCYFATSPFPLQRKTNACSRGSRGCALPPPRAHPRVCGAPGHRLVPIFCYMKGFDLGKKIERSFRDEAPPSRGETWAEAI